MSFAGIVSLLAIFCLKVAASASVDSAIPNALHSPIVLDASGMSNSLNDHLANIVKSNTPNLKINTTVPLVPSNTSSTVEDANDADLKTDSSGWYQYNRYRYQPLYRPPFGLNPYYWPYVQYNHPFYPYQYRYRYRYPTYNYFGQYYTGRNYYSPYRPYRPPYQPYRPAYQPVYRPAYRPPYRPRYRSPYRRPYPNYFHY